MVEQRPLLGLRWRESRSLRILDFDFESRPLHHAGHDWTSAEITAMAWSWIGSGDVDYVLLQRDGKYAPRRGKKLAAAEALAHMRDLLEEADFVTGHYIRKFDLPLLQGQLLEAGLRPLGPVMAQDTKVDLVRVKDLSVSQKNLAAMHGLDEQKVDMSQDDWRRANRLTDEGIAKARERVTGDIVQHIAERAYLLEQGALKPPRRWNP